MVKPSSKYLEVALLLQVSDSADQHQLTLCVTAFEIIVKICPNQSPVLNMRLPGYELWTARKVELGFAVIVISLIGTQLFRGIEMTGYFKLIGGESPLAGYGLLIVGTVVLAALFTIAAGRYVFRNGSQTERDYLFMAYALTPLAFAFEAGFHRERLLTMGGQILPVLARQFASAADLPGVSASKLAVNTLQVLLLLLGGMGSAWVLGRLRRGKGSGAKSGGASRVME